MAGHEPVRDAQPEQDCLARVRDAQHECVADCLHMSRARRELTPDRIAEVRDQGCRFLVAVGFGQRGKAGDVGKQEARRGRQLSYSSTVKLNIMPLSWCSAMWQCAIHTPTFVTSSRMSTVSPVRTRTV